ncbi:Type II toxin-antitoxin system VapC family toxin [Gammaproteobacteria bacterium]
MNEKSLLILDSHAWIWWIDQDGRLPRKLREFIDDYGEEIAVSAASVYEITILVNRGRIQLSRKVDDWIMRSTRGVDIGILPINGIIAQHAGCLPLHHGDPLDRLIIASAIHHDALLASVDSKFPSYEELNGRLISGKDFYS